MAVEESMVDNALKGTNCGETRQKMRKITGKV
jgi:hypothetical protein